MTRHPKIGTIKILLTILIFSVFSCNSEEKFDKNKWDEDMDAGIPSPHRNKMLKDLTANHKLVGLSYSELIGLLGQPNFKDSISLGYKVVEDYGSSIDPIHTKKINFTVMDSVIKSFKVVEWKK